MELVTKRDMNDARRLMIHCDIRHVEGAEYLIHDVAQFIADGRRRENVGSNVRFEPAST